MTEQEYLDGFAKLSDQMMKDGRVLESGIIDALSVSIRTRTLKDLSEKVKSYGEELLLKIKLQKLWTGSNH